MQPDAGQKCVGIYLGKVLVVNVVSYVSNQ